jgi:hypothetical protein
MRRNPDNPMGGSTGCAFDLQADCLPAKAFRPDDGTLDTCEFDPEDLEV